MDTNIATVSNGLYFLVMSIAVTKLNPAIKDFFQGEFLMFLIFTLFFYQKNKNVLVSVATAFFAVISITVVTMQDFNALKEKFQLIYPSTNTKIGCEKLTIADLLEKVDGDEKVLRDLMARAGVPHNLNLTDYHASEIATYLVNSLNLHQFRDLC
jgi:hypothetical protein